MKKEYAKPSVVVAEIQSCQMMAQSLGLSRETVGRDDVLSKEDDSWDMWDK